MEALSYTYIALAEENAEVLAAREIHWPEWKEATSVLLVVAAVQGGHASASGMQAQYNQSWPDTGDNSVPAAMESESQPSSIPPVTSKNLPTESFDPSFADPATVQSVEKQLKEESSGEQVWNFSKQNKPFDSAESLAFQSVEKQSKEESPEEQVWTFSKPSKLSLEGEQLAEKASKPVPEQPVEEQETGRYGAYPRPYYSRATIPDYLKISPFHLVDRAYKGGFKDSGIPSYTVLIQRYMWGKLEAEDIIRAGIIQGRLTTADLYDPSYVSAVNLHLRAIAR